VLSCLTDYITCASQNELFDTFCKKINRNALPALLIRLDSKWVRFFHELGQYGKLSFDALNREYCIQKKKILLFYILGKSVSGLATDPFLSSGIVLYHCHLLEIILFPHESVSCAIGIKVRSLCLMFLNLKFSLI
jgi:hypothetical protein